MPARGIHHVDLAVRDVERSLAFYLAILGPLGLREEERFVFDPDGMRIEIACPPADALA